MDYWLGIGIHYGAEESVVDVEQMRKVACLAQRCRQREVASGMWVYLDVEFECTVRRVEK